MLAVAADLASIAMMDAELDRPPVTGGASIYPFCWNLLLSARAHGLGGVMTTFLSRVEPAAAPALGLPEHHALVATIFLGVPVHQPTKLTRHPVETFATTNRFDGPAFSVGERVTIGSDAAGELCHVDGGADLGDVVTDGVGAGVHQPADDAGTLDHAVGDPRRLVGLRGVGHADTDEHGRVGDRLQAGRRAPWPCRRASPARR